MKRGIIDSHAHICGHTLWPRFDEVVREATHKGITKILIVCTEIEEARRAIEVAKGNELFDVAVGFYPNDINKITDADWIALEELIQCKEVVALGEIGMDYFSDEVPKERQKEAFIRQIHMANSIQKPILVHMRLATEDTLAIMKEHLKVNGIMHCYSGGYDAMQTLLEMGMYISFSGNITFEDDQSTFKAVKHVPMDRIFVETDSPCLTPAPVQHLDNEPKYIEYVIAKVCDLKGIDQEILIDAMYANYKRLFNQ